MAESRSFARITVALLLAVSSPREGAAEQGTVATPPASSATAAQPAIILGVAIDEAGITPVDLQRSRELVLSVFEGLPQGSQMMIAAFSGDRRIVLPPTADRALASAALDTFKPGETGVALPDGLFDMVEYLGGRPAETRAMILFSAGRLRDGDLHFEDPLNAASSKRIRIFAISLGQGDGKMLRRIAKLTGGDYVRLEVADAPTLSAAIRNQGEPVDAAAPKTEGASAEASPTPKPSGGLLGAAAIFFSLGGLLMLGIVILLVRRLSAAPQDPPTRVVSARPSPKDPRPAPPSPSLELDEEPLEKTLVVNATPTLRALSGPGAGRNFPLQASGQTSIGRSRRNDIVVPEDAASAQHCRIDREGDSYVLYDLGATNGTWINGVKTQRSLLQHGDRLKVGETVFTVSLFGDRS
jgi:hypothetical protein